MPKATETMSADNAPSTESSISQTHGHNTRKKQMVYSHYRAPYTPAPARNTNRPTLPSLGGRRKKGAGMLFYIYFVPHLTQLGSPKRNAERRAVKHNYYRR
jgi:hypothetical protein